MTGGLIPVTIRHRFDFGESRELVGDDLVRPEAWDALRISDDESFRIARSAEELEREADETPALRERMAALDAWLRAEGAASVASYGVGGAVAELWLHRHAPQRDLIVTEYADATREQLLRILPGVEVRGHDLRRDPPVPADVHVFHRIDTEFTNGEWRDILRRFANEVVVVIAAEVASYARLKDEWDRRKRPGQTDAGWLRNRPALEWLWRTAHAVERRRFHDLHGWVLRPC